MWNVYLLLRSWCACFVVVYLLEATHHNQIPFTACPFQRYSFRVVEGRSFMTDSDNWQRRHPRKQTDIAISFLNHVLWQIIISPRFTRSSRLPVVRDECSVMTYAQVAQGPAFVEELRMCQFVSPWPCIPRTWGRDEICRDSGPILGVSMTSIV